MNYRITLLLYQFIKDKNNFIKLKDLETQVNFNNDIPQKVFSFSSFQTYLKGFIEDKVKAEDLFLNFYEFIPNSKIGILHLEEVSFSPNRKILTLHAVDTIEVRSEKELKKNIKFNYEEDQGYQNKDEFGFYGLKRA